MRRAAIVNNMRTISAKVQLKKILAVGLKGLGSKTN
jgi:hypothetical protein